MLAYRFCEFRVVSASLHVEGFNLHWELTQKYWLANLVSHLSLRGLWDIL